MKKRIILYIFLILSPILAFCQFDPKTDKYIHKSLFVNKDTINYHLYSKGTIEGKNKILIFFHGSGPTPLFSEAIHIDTLSIIENGETKKKIQKSKIMGSSVPFDLDKIPDEYLFVLISKKGVPFININETFKPNKIFYENEGLDYRVWQGNKVINELTKNGIKKPDKLVIIGHSEGSDVVAKLGHQNKKITHVGFWAGGANTQYYDFALFIQKEVQNGKITQTQASKSLDSLFIEIKNIENDPTNTNKQWQGNSYRRWSKFAEPSLDNLLKINKPIFVAVGGKDEAVPIESSLLIPIEFIRHKKNNLTFKIYPEFNHSFAIAPKNENDNWDWKWMTVFDEFIKWVEE